MPNPFDRFDTAAPTVIHGAPPPAQAGALVIQDQTIRGNANDLQRDPYQTAKAIADAKKAEIEAESAARKAAATGGVDTTESEKTAAFLGTRVASGISVLKDLSGTGDPTLGTAAAAAVPFGFGNYATPEARQRTTAAQLDVLDAALTLGTGAAYTPDQLENYRTAYFPQLGDADATKRDKAGRLRVLLEAARVKAGAASPMIDQALKMAGIDPAGGPSGAGDMVANKTGEKEFFTPEDRLLSQMEQELIDTPGVTRADFESLAKRFGRGSYGPDLDAAIEAKRNGQKAQVKMRPTGRSGPTVLGAMAGSAIGSYFGGAGDAVTLGFQDEIIGLTGGNTGDARLSTELMRRDHPYTNVAGELTGGLLLPAGAATGPAGLARLGAMYGAGYGAGSADGDLGDRAAGAGVGALLGAGTGAVFGVAGNALSRLRGPVNRPPNGPAALLEAANRQGIDPLPADVGGPITRRLTSGIAQSPWGGGSIVRGAQRVVDQSEVARNRIAGTVGNAVDPVAAGEAATAGAQSYIGSSRVAGNRQYDRAQDLAGSAVIDPDATRNILDRHIAELAQSPLGAPAALTNLRAQLDGQFTVAGLRNTRTQLRDEFAAQGLRGSDAERRGMEAVDALTTDIAAGLRAQGREEAAQAYLRADTHWRERLDTIDNALQPIIGDGNLSGEKVMRNIMSATRSDSGTLRRFVDALPNDEQQTVRATVINQLGRANPGQQNAEGQRFSLDTFLTHWNQMTERAKGVMFQGEARAALNDLATVATGARQASQYANRSNTSGALMSLVNVTTGGAQWITGRILASPRLTRILASPVSTPERVIRRLETLAVREPALQADIQPIIGFLTNSISEGASRSAASENVDRRRQEPPRQQSPQQ